MSYVDFRNPDSGRVSHLLPGSRRYNQAIAEGWQRLTPLQVVEVRKEIIAGLPAPTPVPVPTIMADPGDWIVPDDPPVATVAIYDVDRPRRDPTAFADVDPVYVKQIELRQEVQQLGRAFQTTPTAVAQVRLQEKYDEYIEVREERGAMIPSPEIQARAVAPRPAGHPDFVTTPTLVATPPVVAPVPVAAGPVEPLTPGLNFRADSGLRKLLFLGIVASIVKGLSK